jgi:hypothetical protein
MDTGMTRGVPPARMTASHWKSWWPGTQRPSRSRFQMMMVSSYDPVTMRAHRLPPPPGGSLAP